MKKIYAIIILLSLGNLIHSSEDERSDHKLGEKTEIDAFKLAGIQFKDLSENDKESLSDYLSLLCFAINGAVQSRDPNFLIESNKKIFDEFKNRAEEIKKTLNDRLKKLLGCIEFHAFAEGNFIYSSYAIALRRHKLRSAIL